MPVPWYCCSVLQEIHEKSVNDCPQPCGNLGSYWRWGERGRRANTHETVESNVRAYSQSPNSRFHTKYSPSLQKGDTGGVCIILLRVFNHSVIASRVFAFHSLILSAECTTSPLQQ